MIVDNWDKVKDEAVADLQTLIRFVTVNPPGDEGPAAEYVANRLKEAGVSVDVLDCEGRPNVVARIVGDGSLPGGPLLLAGHLDVVPVEEEHWTHPPFDAVIDNDYLYGRGALDMKSMMAMCLTVVRQLALHEVALGRDIIFAAVADEETGCWHGSRFLVEEHPELVTAECMLGEFGAFSLDSRGKRFYPIQVGEKGACRLELVAKGEPGHGSMPSKDSAVVRLAEAVVKLGRTRLPQHRVATVEKFVRTMAEHQKLPASLILPQILNPLLSSVVLDRVLPAESAKSFAAMLSNTVSPTILEAGDKINVIPSTARARLDGRLLPGQTTADLVKEIAAVVGSEIEIRLLASHPGRENSGQHPLLDVLSRTIIEHDPTGIPVPYLAPGFTDAAYFGRVVDHCFGFNPVRFPVEDEISPSKLLHAHDERIHVPGFKWGLRVLFDAVAAHCVRS